jgi:hypothetical protein
MIDGADYARQRAEVTFNFWLGENYLDLREGMPYRRDDLIKDPNRDVVRSVIRRGWLTVPGIVAVKNVNWSPDFSARAATIDTEAVYQDGTPISVSQEVII